MAEGQKALVSLHGYFWMLLGHYTRGSCKTRQCSSGSNKFRVLAQVPPVASRSPPPNSRALQNNNMAEGQKASSLHGYFWMLLGHYTRGSCKTRQCSSGSNKFRVLAQVPPVASRSPPNSRALQNNTIWLKVKKHWCPCTGTSGCFSVTTLGAPARQGNVAQGQTSFVSLHKCPRLLLGHHQTHRPCKTTQYG